MGITLHYRGTVADLSQVEDMEDRLVDLALDFGGQARIWRSHSRERPERVVRGVILSLSPGHESLSLLVTPEGWLVGLFEIKDAEEGRLTETPPWCFCKTQFGSVEAHVAAVEVLTALKAKFIPDLEVLDDGDYWETRDLLRLREKFAFLNSAIRALKEGLQTYGMSPEAAEDPEIVAKRVERIAAMVHARLKRPSEHPPVEVPPEADFLPRSAEVIEAEWDELERERRRNQERLYREVEDRIAAGEDAAEALAHALERPNLTGDVEDDESDEVWSDEGPEEFLSDPEDEVGLAFERDTERHPLLERASQLWVRLEPLGDNAESFSAAALNSVFEGLGDLCGGLAQALSRGPCENDIEYGHTVVQFKRALRGIGFARGGIANLGKDGPFGDIIGAAWTELGELDELVFHELERVRSEFPPSF